MSHTFNLFLNNQSLSRILYFKSSLCNNPFMFLTFLFRSAPRGSCVANRNIGRKNKYISVILAFVVYSIKLVTSPVGISLPSVFRVGLVPLLIILSSPPVVMAGGAWWGSVQIWWKRWKACTTPSPCWPLPPRPFEQFSFLCTFIAGYLELEDLILTANGVLYLSDRVWIVD